MPIYEYEAVNPDKACDRCRQRFELIQGINEEPISACPYCGQAVRRVISRCRAAVIEVSETDRHIEAQIRQYENQGMWSHAAELADKHSEKTKDKNTKMRALDNYKKAGYDAKALEKHVKRNSEE